MSEETPQVRTCISETDPRKFEEKHDILNSQAKDCLTKKISLPEFLDACHIHLQLNLNILNKYRRNKYRCSPFYESMFIDIRSRIRPEKIRKWDNFLQQQTPVWDELMQAGFMCGEHFNFLNELKTYTTAMSYMSVNVQSISDISWLHRNVIGDHVTEIVKQIYQNPMLRKSFRLNGMITYVMAPTTLTDDREWFDSQISPPSVDRDVPSKSQPNKPSSQSIESKFRQVDQDQICVYNTILKGDNYESQLLGFPATPALIVEFKHPRLLKLEYIKEGLRDMDLNDVVKYGITDGPREKCCQLVAGLISRVFSYMIQTGLEYGCLWTGEAAIFLRVLEDARTVLYHLSVPKDDVGQSTGWSEEPNADNRLHLTAVGQMLAFTLQAIRTPARANSWRVKAMHELKKWRIDYKGLIKSLELDGSILETSKSSGDTSVTIQSPIRFQSNSISLDSCSTWPEKKESREKDEPCDIRQGLETKYCTHKCLAGLKRGGPLDEACPNSAEHGNGSHQISQKTFLELIQRQFSESMDTDVELITRPGSRGAPFRVRLASHGYTLFAKFCPSWQIRYLKYEATVYDQLGPIQGNHVPVHLGNIDLEQPYIFEGIVLLVHVMFLSFGGSSLNEGISKEDMPGVYQQILAAYEEIHQLNVIHKDSAPRNILFDRVTGKVLVTDFERASFTELQDAQCQIKRKRSDSSIDEQISESKQASISPMKKKIKLTHCCEDKRKLDNELCKETNSVITVEKVQDNGREDFDVEMKRVKRRYAPAKQQYSHGFVSFINNQSSDFDLSS